MLDPSASSPAKQISAISLLHPSLAHFEGSYANAEDIHALAKRVDVVTAEIEHVDVDALFRIRDQYRTKGGNLDKGIEIYPSPEVLAIVQDKLAQKKLLRQSNIPVAEFIDLDNPSVENVKQAAETLGLPLLLKARRNAYDGRGNFLLKDLDDLPRARTALQGSIYAEAYAKNVAHEIVVVLVRSTTGEIRSYSIAENIHVGKIGHLVRAPLRQGGESLAKHAQALAEKAITALGDGAVGVFGVEFLVLADSKTTLLSPLNSSGD